MAYLLEWGVKIPDTNMWKWPESEWLLVDASVTQIMHFVKSSLLRAKWMQTETNSYGAMGMGSQPSFTDALRAVKKRHKEGFHLEAHCLRCVLAGGSYMGERFGTNRTCMRCSKAVVENPYHRYYECPANDSLQNAVGAEWISKTTWAKKVAMKSSMKP